MRKLLVHWWQACVAGILVGIPIGITLELARRRYNDAASVEIDHQFERQGHVAAFDSRFSTALGRAYSHDHDLCVTCSFDTYRDSPVSHQPYYLFNNVPRAFSRA